MPTAPKSSGHTVFQVIIILVALYAVVVGAAYVLQRHLLYVPDQRRIPPAAVGLSEVREIELARPDGVTLIAWYAPAQAGRRTLLYFHGNGGSLAGRSERMASYIAGGDGMFMLSYRGYGGSGGVPSEAANVADATAAYDWLREQGTPAEEIVLYGESLGSGVAVQVALARPVAGVILDAPYTSIPDVGQHHYWYLPVHLLARDRYPTVDLVGRVMAPILIIHGSLDATTPVEMGRRVFEAASEPKQLSVIDGAGHDNHHALGAFEVVQTWLSRLPDQEKRPQR